MLPEQFLPRESSLLLRLLRIAKPIKGSILDAAHALSRHTHHAGH